MESLESENTTALGRPTITDDRLAGDRDRLAWLLSVAWGEIGWQLANATTPEELRLALEPLREHPSEYLIARFKKETSASATAKEIREIRKALGKVIRSASEADKKHAQCANAFREAETAIRMSGLESVDAENKEESPMPVPQAPHLDDEQRNSLRAELKRRHVEFEAAKKALDELCRAEQTSQNELAHKEAAFAQTEVLDFITMKKYARHPLGLANAMAGLPDMGWRQSYARCSKLSCTGWPHFEFRVFETIRAIWNRRDTYPQLSTVELFRNEIEKLPRTVETTVPEWPPRAKMRKARMENPLRCRLADFFYLRLAIEESLKSNVHPRRMPFLIVSHFSANLGKSRSAIDLVLAARERVE